MIPTKQKKIKKNMFSAQSMVVNQQYSYESDNFSYDYKMNRIYEGVRISNGQKVLIKTILTKNTFHKDDRNTDIRNQAEILDKITHQNINKPHGVIPRDKSMYLIFQKPYTTLEQFMHKKNLTEDQIFFIWIDILIALHSCRQHGLVHRCVLPRNVILGENGKWKLSGFQFAINKERKLFCETKKLEHDRYLPPETLRDHIYTEKSEIWSLGIILYELLFKKHPYDLVKRRDELLGVILSKKLIKNSNNHHRIFSHIINSCLGVNPHARLSLQELLKYLYQAKDLPKNFEKTLKLKYGLWNSKTINEQPEHVIDKDLLTKIQKQSYLIFYINRMLKLFKKVQIDAHFELLVVATELYLRRRILCARQQLTALLQKKTVKNNKFNEQIQQCVNNIEHIQQIYSYELVLSENLKNCSQYQDLLNQSLVKQMFLLQYQNLLRNYIVEGVQKIKNYRNQKLLQHQYQIYALDFCVTCFQIEAELIEKGLHDPNLYDFITLETLKRLAENPIQSRIDNIHTQLIAKVQSLGINTSYKQK